MNPYKLQALVHRANKDFLYQEHRERMKRIYGYITHNRTRTFAGHIVPYTEGFVTNLLQDFITMGYLRKDEPTTTYFTDGSHQAENPEHLGIMSAAVTWQEQDEEGNYSWKDWAAPLPRYSGQALDAELCGISMALSLAVQHILVEGRPVRNVVVLTDCQDVVKMLAGEQDTRRPIGPIPRNGIWALQYVYEYAEQLEKNQVSLVVAWSRSYKNWKLAKDRSAEGNKRADALARKVSGQQKAALAAMPAPGDGASGYGLDMWDWIGELEGDLREECLWRLSERWRQFGDGFCHVAPLVSQGIGVQGEDMEEEKRRFEGKEKEKKKAPPLVHLWPRTRSLPKKPYDYGRIYRKGLREMGKRL